MTNFSEKEKLLARRKQYNEACREVGNTPGLSVMSVEEMSPFARHCHENAISPPMKLDWGTYQFEGASQEVLHLQAMYRQATSEEVKRKIGHRIRDLTFVQDSPLVSYLVAVSMYEPDPEVKKQIYHQIEGGPIVVPVPDDPKAALEALMKSKKLL